MKYVEPIRDPELIRDIGEYLKEKDEKLFIMYEIGIYSGLRISDILKLKIKDVKGKKTIKLRETKTGKEKIFPTNTILQKELKEYCEDKKPHDYVVPKKGQPGKPIGRDYAYRVLHEAGMYFGLDNIGTHTMRKTFGYHFYRKTKDVVLLMKIFNHTNESRTLRYIGIEQTDINEAMMKFNYDYHAIQQVQSAQPEQIWIPCSERLPEESGYYIITAHDGVGHRTTFVKYQKKAKSWDLTGARSYWRVIAWMPLPEPYAEGREERI